MTYAPPPPLELPPVLMDLPEGADDDGDLVTGVYLNVGLSAAAAAPLVAPMPVPSGDTEKRARVNTGLQVASVLLAVASGGFLAASSDIPRPAEGVANWAELVTVAAFVLSLILGAVPKVLGRKYRKTLRAWVDGVERASAARGLALRLDSIENPGLRTEIRELGESLGQSRESIMTASRDRHARVNVDGELFAALAAVANYALHPGPHTQTEAREAVFTFADRADNYVHTGNPDTALGDLKA